MIKEGTNKEIRKHLLRLSGARPSAWYSHKIRKLIDMRPDIMHSGADVVELMAAGGSNPKRELVKDTLYDLCSDNHIMLVSRGFHVWEESIIQRKNTRVLFYSKTNSYRARILQDWITEDLVESEDCLIVYHDSVIEQCRQEIARLESKIEESLIKKAEILKPFFDAHRSTFLKIIKEQNNE